MHVLLVCLPVCQFCLPCPLLRQVCHPCSPTMQDKERRQAVVQLALACCDAPLLSALLAQPGFSAAGASLHTAVRSLPRELVQRLVLAGAGINQRDEQDGSLLTHKASWAGHVGCLCVAVESGAA